jgi:hypothetical protein
MLNYLVNHAIENVWCAPDQDLQFKTKLSRLTKSFGAVSRFQVLWDTLTLPTKDDRYHVFQIGHVDLNLIGMSKMTLGWNALVDVVNSSTLFCNVFYPDGLTIPKTLIWVHYDVNRNLILAIKDDTNFQRLKNENPYIRVYSNSYFSSEYSTVEDGTFTKGGRVTSTDFILDVQQAYHSRLDESGVSFLYHNGYLVTDFYPSIIKLGDYIEFDYDSSIEKIISLDLKDLNTFESILDKKRKYLLTYPPFDDFQAQKIDYLDDIDVYIRNGNSANNKGLYYHSFGKDHLRMVTHRDYSIPVNYISSFLTLNSTLFPTAGDLSIVLYIRKTGLQRKLIKESSKIHELYKLPHSDIKMAMLGINSNVTKWKAAELENSSYSYTMSKRNLNFTDADVLNLYGYDAMSKMVGETPLKLTSNSVELKIAQKQGSTVFEYDVDGLYLGKNYVHGVTTYNPINNNAKLIEVIIGEGTSSRDITYDVPSMVIDPKLNYRVYLCKQQDSIPDFEWGDISNTSLVAINNNVLTVKYNVVTEYVAIVSDKTFLSYDLQLNPVDGIYKFNVNDGGMVNRITSGDIRLILNGYSLIKDIDFSGTWPEYYIYNKEYLIGTGVQNLTIRCTDFCDSDMKLQSFNNSGFVTHGYLSNNNKFDIIDDKVISIVVEGKLKHISVVTMIEDGNGVAVSTSRNGAPYEIKETFVPLRGGVSMDGYSLRSLSNVVNHEVSNYMTVKYPQNDVPTINPIVRQYELYSLFVTRLLFACVEGEISNRLLTFPYDDNRLRLECQPYLYLLNIDPAKIAQSPYTDIQPFPSKEVIDINIYHHNFIQRAISIYLNGKVSLSKYVTVSMPAITGQGGPVTDVTGGEIIRDENGNITHISIDGTVTFTESDGRVTVTKSDGSKVITEVDGSVTKFDTDGKLITGETVEPVPVVDDVFFYDTYYGHRNVVNADYSVVQEMSMDSSPLSSGLRVSSLDHKFKDNTRMAYVVGEPSIDVEWDVLLLVLTEEIDSRLKDWNLEPFESRQKGLFPMELHEIDASPKRFTLRYRDIGLGEYATLDLDVGDELVIERSKGGIYILIGSDLRVRIGTSELDLYVTVIEGRDTDDLSGDI